MAKNNLSSYKNENGFGMSLNIRRGNPNPLDNSSVWSSLSDAKVYAQNTSSNAISYVGQVISVASSSDASAYIIKNTNGNLDKLAAFQTEPVLSGDNSNVGNFVTVSNDGKLTFVKLDIGGSF